MKVKTDQTAGEGKAATARSRLSDLAAGTLGDRPAMVVTRLKRLGPNLSLRAVIVTLAVGVILPVLLSTSVGIVSIALGERVNNLVVGVLVVSFAAASIGGAITATVLLGRKARTARLQSDFLANVSHELRTPLAAIRMYAQTLQGGQLRQDPEKVERCLDTIVRETEWLETMIERVLTWRSSAKDHRVVELVAQPIGGAVEGALRRFAALTAPGEVELSVEIASTQPVKHDRGAIETVVLNLLINAFKYTGKVKRIAVRAADRAGEVVLEVQDNGVGIPAADRKKIFEPFYRCDNRLRGQAAGAGLGLAIVKAMVTAHEGVIQARSVIGKGTTMVVSLPASSSSEVDA